MLGRRAFLFGCGCMGTVPAFARVGLPFETRNVHGLLSPDPSAQVEATTNENLVFRIDGWESPIDVDGPADTRATIRINSSWQTAWH